MGMRCESSPPPSSSLPSSAGDRYLVPMATYIKNRMDISFYEIMAVTNQKRHLAIGYKVFPPFPPDSDLCQLRGEIVINPPNKSTRAKWSPKTELIIIAVDLK